MATNETLIPIPGRLHSVATEGHVAGANEIYDDSLGKSQSTINGEVDEVIDDVALIDTSSSSPAVVPEFDPESETVHLTAQTLSEVQKAQVRTNIGLNDVDARISQAVASEASQRASAVSAETSRAQAAESALQNNIQALTQSDIVVVEDHTQVQDPDATTIYREFGESSYADWMYQNSAWQKMAEYDNAIDNVPTAGSNNLVKSGGVYSSISNRLIKLAGFGRTAAEAGATNDGDVYYAINNKKLKKINGASEEEVPFVNGAVYNSDDILYIWNGTNMVFADQEAWLGSKVFSYDAAVSSSMQQFFKTVVQNSNDTYYIQVLSSTATFSEDDYLGIIINTSSSRLTSLGNGWFKYVSDGATVGVRLTFFIAPAAVSQAGNIKMRIFFGYSSEQIEEKAQEKQAVETRFENIEDQLLYKKCTLLGNGVEGDNYVYHDQTIGQQISFGNFGKHTVFNIPANKAARVLTIPEGSYGFALTDLNDNVLEYFYASQHTDYTFQQHDFATKLYVSNEKYKEGYQVEIMTLLDYVDEFSQSYWYGKTLWWCGTSIPAGSDNTIESAETIAGNYPEQVGIDLNCNVINKAAGGSMCRANIRTGDYNGVTIQNISMALTMTKSEAEDFITNYDTLKLLPLNHVDYNMWPDSLSQLYLTRLRTGSFEDRLLPYLDGTYDMPDLFVFDHGHNDYKWFYRTSELTTDIGLEPTVENIESGELAEDTYMTANNNAMLEHFFGSLDDIPEARKAEFIASVNRNCFIGAVNFLVTLILRYNPHARIVFISNFEYEHGVRKQDAPVILAQRKISDSWAFPLCEMYKYLGYSDHIIPGSKSWFNNTYPNLPTVDTDITAYKAYLADNVHPHSDITGTANKDYAGVISEFLKGCR